MYSEHSFEWFAFILASHADSSKWLLPEEFKHQVITVNLYYTISYSQMSTHCADHTHIDVQPDTTKSDH